VVQTKELMVRNIVKALFGFGCDFFASAFGIIPSDQMSALLRSFD
jgi:hypothetical protein